MFDLPEALTDRVAFLLRLALTNAESMGEQALHELNLRGREYGVLALLEHGTPSAQRQLGDALGMDRTTTAALLAGLESRGLVDRTPDPANRRAHRVVLTVAGDGLRARAARVLARCDESFLAPLTASDRTQLSAMLRELINPPPLPNSNSEPHS